MRSALVLVGLSLSPLSAAAQFAEPPAENFVVEQPASTTHPAHTALRVHVGPAVALAHAEAGLFAALDVGRGRVGGRFSVSAVALGADRGSAVATAELWLCPVELGPLRGLLGAGAGVRDQERQSATDRDHTLAGVGVFRGGLELALPIPEADARLGASVAAHIPAIVEAGPAETSALFVASLALGF